MKSNFVLGSTSRSIIQTAFKDFLFLPKFDKNSKKKKESKNEQNYENKERYPPVATGEAWRNLWDLKKEQREQEERAKADRKSKTMENKKIKLDCEENLKKIKPQKIKLQSEVREADLKIKQYKAQEKLLHLQLKNGQFKENETSVQSILRAFKEK